MTNRAMVVGAGYAGLTTAANEPARDGCDVTDVMPVAEFVERVWLHRASARLRESAAHDLSAELHQAVHQRCSTKTIWRRIWQGSLPVRTEKVSGRDGRPVIKTLIRVSDLNDVFG